MSRPLNTSFPLFGGCKSNNAKPSLNFCRSWILHRWEKLGEEGWKKINMRTWKVAKHGFIESQSDIRGNEEAFV